MDKIKILYVDDEEINLMLFEAKFSKKFDVYTEDCGKKGLEILKSVKGIIIVISDMKMPEMNGIEFIKQAKCEHCEVKFFILTGFEKTPEIEDALKSKLIRSYFRKPFDTEEIEREILKALNE